MSGIAVQKDGKILKLSNETQLSAFLKSGWEQTQWTGQAAKDNPDELETLRSQAFDLGLKVHHAVGVEKLRAQIAAKLEGDANGQDNMA